MKINKESYMEGVHFVQGNLVRKVPVDPTYLDRLIHASFVEEMTAPSVTQNIKSAARIDIEEVSRFETTSLGDFVPQGNPFFANAGFTTLIFK